MSNEPQVGWLGIYKIYLIVATVLCVVAPVMRLFQYGIGDLSTFGSVVVRIFVFAFAAATASRLAETAIRQFHLALNAAAAFFGLAFVGWRFFSALPFLPDVVQLLGGFIVVPWYVLVPNGLYQLYPVMSVVGLIAASTWAVLLATHDPSRQPAAMQSQAIDHSVDQQQPNHNIQATRTRKPWRPLLISLVFALATNLIPLAVIEIGDEKYGWLLFFVTVPVGGLILIIGLIWSIVLVSNKH